MTMRMLIDARHREETRVAVVKGSRIEEFDFESAEHKQLKGNIYLAKVTRVEPSLQAAFVEYGGNRHGFLAFSEIHPDYYQIPKEDRDALLREEAEHAAEEERLRADEDDDLDPADGHHDDDGYDSAERDEAATLDEDEGEGDADAQEPEFAELSADAENDDEAGEETRTPAPAMAERNDADAGAVENLREKRMNLRHRYKIQDVIRRRQVLLVQVVKEERGNKGAALTSYLSLAGRYCVLMPNTTHGGGISRKISNAGDRKRLKSIMAELNLPKTMGCIVRTAGLQRTKTEIRRDFDYLARLWDEVREKTLGSAAPALIYQDSDLIKRAIRDIYNKDIDEVVIEGEDGYKQAKSFMRLLMPSHAARVKPYADTVPLFQRNGVEDQLAAMYSPVVQLKSGGYLVINPTEALVSIDINSGRSTREYGIEATAVGTNLEAANEIARQLRLRDMAGLVVIDFIDMENSGNIRKVERAMKNALADDRARIQVGRISSFGLMEMSRQRLRTGVLEASTRGCPHCEGTGLVRTASSAGLSALRMLEDEAGRGRGSQLRLTASKEAALYVLNRKRAELGAIEERYGVEIEVASDNEDEGGRMTVDVAGPPPAYRPRIEAPVYEEEDEPFEDVLDADEDADEEDERVASVEDDDERPRSERSGEREGSGERGEGEGRGRRRRRRGKRTRPDERAADERTADDTSGEAVATVDGDVEDEETAGTVAREELEAGTEGERKRRGRRGGRRRRGRDGDRTPVEGGTVDAAPSEAVESDVDGEDGGSLDLVASDRAAADVGDGAAPVEAELPLPAPMAAAQDGLSEAATIESDPDAVEAAVAPKPRRARKPKAEAVEAQVDAPVEDAAPEKPKRTRKKAGDVEALAVADAGDEPAPKPRRSRKKVAADAAPADAGDEAEPPLALVVAPQEADALDDREVTPVVAEGGLASADAESASDEPKRGGWWQRTFGGQS